MGVPLGVRLGVDDALSFLAFLELDLGVMLEFRNVLTGVALSFKPSIDLPSELRGVIVGVVGTGEALATGDPATLDKKGSLPVHLRGPMPAIGRSFAMGGCFLFCL